jgi:hypothetical protein
MTHTQQPWLGAGVETGQVWMRGKWMSSWPPPLTAPAQGFCCELMYTRESGKEDQEPLFFFLSFLFFVLFCFGGTGDFFSCGGGQHMIKIIVKKERFHFILTHNFRDFSPWSFGSIVSWSVVRQSIMAGITK